VLRVKAKQKLQWSIWFWGTVTAYQLTKIFGSWIRG